MKIAEVVLKNFGIYYGENKIPFEFPNDSQKKNFIVSGNNGAGKTTFLSALCWCLYGKKLKDVDTTYKKAINGTPGGVPAFLKNYLNRDAIAEGEKEFSVSIKFVDVDLDGIPSTLEVKRSYNTYEPISDTLELFINGQLLSDDGFADENEKEEFISRNILPREIARFFFFDAEKIVDMANFAENEKQQELAASYSQILGVQAYENVCDRLSQLHEVCKKKSATNEGKRKLSDCETRIKESQEKIEEYDKKIEEANSRIAENGESLKEVDGEIRSRSAFEDAGARGELEEKIKSLEDEKESAEGEIVNCYEMLPFAIMKALCLDVKQRISLEERFRKEKKNTEESHKKIGEIETEIMNSHEFHDVVWTPEKNEVRKKIFNILGKILPKYIASSIGDDDVLPENFEAFLNFSDREVNEFCEICHKANELPNKLNLAQKKWDEKESERKDANRKLKTALDTIDTPYVKSLCNKRERLEREIEQDKDKSVEWRIRKDEEMKRVYNPALRQKSEILSMIKASQKDEANASTISEIHESIKAFLKSFKEQKKESLQKSVLCFVKELAHKELVEKVNASFTDSGGLLFEFVDAQGRSIGNSSAGESQLYAISLLQALVKESGIDFPVFIDSPLQKLDPEHRSNIIKHFFPNISSQIVIFPIRGSELSATEFKMMRDNVAGTFQLNTTENKTRFDRASIEEFSETLGK